MHSPCKDDQAQACSAWQKPCLSHEAGSLVLALLSAEVCRLWRRSRKELCLRHGAAVLSILDPLSTDARLNVPLTAYTVNIHLMRLLQKQTVAEEQQHQQNGKAPLPEDFDHAADRHRGQLALRKLYHESDRLLLVLYTSPSCGPCRTLKPIFNKVVDDYPGKVCSSSEPTFLPVSLYVSADGIVSVESCWQVCMEPQISAAFAPELRGVYGDHMSLLRTGDLQSACHAHGAATAALRCLPRWRERCACPVHASARSSGQSQVHMRSVTTLIGLVWLTGAPGGDRHRGGPRDCRGSGDQWDAHSAAVQKQRALAPPPGGQAEERVQEPHRSQPLRPCARCMSTDLLCDTALCASFPADEHSLKQID